MLPMPFDIPQSFAYKFMSYINLFVLISGVINHDRFAIAWNSLVGVCLLAAYIKTRTDEDFFTDS